jgi:hypothetical protein
MEPVMSEDLVMRSVYLRPIEDAQLRQLAVDLNVTKSDLVRAAVGIKLKEWLSDNSKTKAAQDVAVGLRDATIARRVKQELPPTAVRFASAPLAKASAPEPPVGRPVAAKAAAHKSMAANATTPEKAAKRTAPKKTAAKG